MSRDVARREVRRAVESFGGRGKFAEKAGIDPGTLGDFLDGARWAQPRTRTKIEKALGWPAGLIMDIADGVLQEVPPPVFDVIHAIRNDPNLLPEAREHLERQYGLLLRVKAAEPREAVQARATGERLAELRARRQPKKAKDRTGDLPPPETAAKHPR